MDEIVVNARSGEGPCSNCPAYESGNSEYVNPGLSEWDTNVMVVTEEPKHFVDWDSEESWMDWNQDFMSTYPEADGGQLIDFLLEPLDIDIHDVWIADSIKCPTTTARSIDTVELSSEEVFQRCRPYLAHEVRAIEPALIIGLGNKAVKRTASVLGQYADPSSIKRPGEIFDTEPPIVVSPHWGARVYYPNEYPGAKKAAQTAIKELYEEFA